LTFVNIGCIIEDEALGTFPGALFGKIFGKCRKTERNSMKIRPLSVLVLALVFVGLGTGCGTMSKRGSHGKTGVTSMGVVPFRTDSPAVVTVDNKKIGPTPLDFVPSAQQWKNGFAYTVEFVDPPGHPVSGTATSTVDWMVVGKGGAWLPFPIIAGASWITDWRTGAIYRLVPEFVDLKRVPLRLEDAVVIPLRTGNPMYVFPPADPTTQPVKKKKQKAPTTEPGT
jgi:hypothetical protein